MANPYHFVVGLWRAKRHNFPVKYYWEIISDNLKKRGWSWACVSAVDSNGRTIFVADAHRDDGKRFVVHADEKLTAFVELELAICACRELCLSTARRKLEEKPIVKFRPERSEGSG